MHYWGDEFKYFDQVAEAAEEIGEFCRRWGRIGVTQTKEKYGTARVYCSFGCSSLGSLISPGTMYYGHWPKWSKWLWWVYIPNWINKLLVPYQFYIYRLAYKIAINKYPMIKEEILNGADWNEYLKGL